MCTTSAGASSDPPVWYLEDTTDSRLGPLQRAEGERKRHLLSCGSPHTASANASDGHSTTMKTGPGSVGVQTCSGRICSNTASANGPQSCRPIRGHVMAPHLPALVGDAPAVLQRCDERPDGGGASGGGENQRRVRTRSLAGEAISPAPPAHSHRQTQLSGLGNQEVSLLGVKLQPEAEKRVRAGSPQNKPPPEVRLPYRRRPRPGTLRRTPRWLGRHPSDSFQLPQARRTHLQLLHAARGCGGVLGPDGRSWCRRCTPPPCTAAPLQSTINQAARRFKNPQNIGPKPAGRESRLRTQPELTPRLCAPTLSKR